MKTFHEFTPKSIPVLDLKFDVGALSPTMSRQTVDVHYNILTKNYAKKFAETGDEFQEQGIRLHNIWWANLTDKRVNPSPFFVEWVSDSYDSWNGFVNELKETGKQLKGNGWLALYCIDHKPMIELIPNHSYKKSILDNMIGLWDMWEHSFIMDYPGKRDVYLQNLMKITDWRTVENRLVNQVQKP